MSQPPAQLDLESPLPASREIIRPLADSVELPDTQLCIINVESAVHLPAKALQFSVDYDCLRGVFAGDAMSMGVLYCRIIPRTGSSTGASCC